MFETVDCFAPLGAFDSHEKSDNEDVIAYGHEVAGAAN
jgi:hypothetical protein